MGALRHTPLAVLLGVGCAHAPADVQSEDVLAVTELAARYALQHDVPPVLREPSAVCLEVDGKPPPPAVLSRLSADGVQVSAGPSGCTGPRALLVQVGGVVVSAESARATAGVQMGRTGVLDLRKAQGGWHVVRPPGPANEGPRLSVPLRP